MTHYNYLIIGGGMTADAAVAGIRQVDQQGSIGLVSSESHPPYDRPPLSKGLWKGKPLEKIFRQASQAGVDLHLSRRVESLDPDGKRATDDQGEVFTYDKLLLATGGTPRRLPFGGDEILYYRTLDDYQYLQELVEKGGRFAVIGGGFIGSEIAAVLATKGQPVAMLFPEYGIKARLFPPDLSLSLNDYYREKGVEVLAGELISGLERRGEKSALLTKSGRQVMVDHVIAGIGILPNTELASAAGIEVADGIIVDENLRTSQPDIYAAGDAANFYNPVLGKRMRVEHEDNALTMGKIAGRNMAGESTRYDHLPMFYSDLFDLGYEAVGEMDPELPTFADWQEPFRKGVVYYLQGSRVRGVLLWNVWGQVVAARRLIGEPGPFSPVNLKGRLPE
ncbi:MAG: pyridine nucleotide-disulfide oxidoreductase [Chloroflexi bacterium RBG_19FT_COMBO_55_16]|nr:MAG: pyridine nucleotide-disulfide oxidoreductase [Chloroflexi bacterium RBG_19FT_COMBO_55_16]